MTFRDNEALLKLQQQFKDSREKVSGVVERHPQGFGFLRVTKGRNIFIPAKLITQVLSGITITATVESTSKGESVYSIDGVLTETAQNIYAVLVKLSMDEDDYVTAYPLCQKSKNVMIKVKDSAKYKDGDIVKLRVLQRACDKAPEAVVLSILGNNQENKALWAIAKDKYCLNAEAAYKPPVKAPDMAQYKDWTSKPFVTIDSNSTRDLDDALYVESHDNVWHLYIAIADPTLLIDEDSRYRQLFIERGVTHYLVNDVIHLMAREYSEELFSIMPDTPVPSLCGVIKIDKSTGAQCGLEFHLALIESKARLSYGEVADHVSLRSVPAIDGPTGVAESLNQLCYMAVMRRQYRVDHNLVGIYDDEYGIALDKYTEEPTTIYKTPKNQAHMMVEEAAIVANNALGLWAKEHNVPVIYSTHDGFRDGCEGNVRAIMHKHKIELADSVYECPDKMFYSAHRALNEALLAFKCLDSQYDIQNTLNSMSDLRGLYQGGQLSLLPKGHKPMGMQAYAKWTSPLRKASDMLNHLAIKAYIRGEDIPAPTESEIKTIERKELQSRYAERYLYKSLGVRHCELEKEFEVTVQRVMSNGIRVVMLDSNIEAYMREDSFKSLTSSGIEFNVAEQCVLLNKEHLVSIGDVISVKVAFADRYTGELVLTV